jgi:hypothetical protein
MPQKKQKQASKKSKVQKPLDKVKLFSINLQYLYYLSKESYKYYMDFNEGEFEQDSQFIFTAHFFNNHVDKTKLDSSIVDIFQDSMNPTLDEISSLIFKTAVQLNMDPHKLLLELIDTQTHIEEGDFHKIKGISPFIKKRITHIINVHNHMMLMMNKKQEGMDNIENALAMTKAKK